MDNAYEQYLAVFLFYALLQVPPTEQTCDSFNDTKFLFRFSIVFIIGFEQTFTTVNESVESLELCIIVINVEDDQDLGVTIPLAVSTIPGSAS